LIKRAPPLPVLRERAGVRAFAIAEFGMRIEEKALTPTLSRSTGRGGKTGTRGSLPRSVIVFDVWTIIGEFRRRRRQGRP